MKRYQLERPCGGQECTVMVSATITSGFEIPDQALLKRRLRETVFRFGDNISGIEEPRSGHLVEPPDSVKISQKHALIRLPSYLVRIHNRESFPRILLEINR